MPSPASGKSAYQWLGPRLHGDDFGTFSRPAFYDRGVLIAVKGRRVVLIEVDRSTVMQRQSGVSVRGADALREMFPDGILPAISGARQPHSQQFWLGDPWVERTEGFFVVVAEGVSERQTFSNIEVALAAAYERAGVRPEGDTPERFVVGAVRSVAEAMKRR